MSIKPLNTQLLDYEGACMRITGKSIDEWDKIFAYRRSKAFASGTLGYGRQYTEEQAEEISLRYGYVADDWEVWEWPVEEITLLTDRENAILEAWERGQKKLTLKSKKKGRIDNVELHSRPTTFLRFRLKPLAQ